MSYRTKRCSLDSVIYKCQIVYFRTAIGCSRGGVTMDLKAIGCRIKEAREDINLTQEELAAIVELSPTHVSVIERGLKAARIDTFVAIANALGVSADTLLVDVVEHSVCSVTNELLEEIQTLPLKEQKKIGKVLKILVED